MEPMTLYEYLCLAKVLSVAMGGMRRNEVSDKELDVASEVLKRMASQKAGWTKQQKEVYKLLVDCARKDMVTKSRLA